MVTLASHSGLNGCMVQATPTILVPCRSMATIRDSENVARRLVKLYLPVETVRRMDAAILRCSGAYLDRAEFVTEAVLDRLAEEGQGVVEQLPIAPARPAKLAAVREAAPEFVPQTADVVGLFGDWLSNGDVATLEP